MTKPLYRRLAVLSLLSLTQFATIPGQAADNEVPVVVKIAGIPWFTAMEKGIKEAGKDRGLNAYMVGPNTADPAQQVRLVEDLVRPEPRRPMKPRISPGRIYERKL